MLSSTDRCCALIIVEEGNLSETDAGAYEFREGHFISKVRILRISTLLVHQDFDRSLVEDVVFIPEVSIGDDVIIRIVSTLLHGQGQGRQILPRQVLRQEGVSQHRDYPVDLSLSLFVHRWNESLDDLLDARLVGLREDRTSLHCQVLMRRAALRRSRNLKRLGTRALYDETFVLVHVLQRFEKGCVWVKPGRAELAHGLLLRLLLLLW